MALTTLADLKTYLGISDSSEDALLNLLIADADAAILGYIGRTIEQATLTEYYSGDGTQMLVLKQRPVTVFAVLYRLYGSLRYKDLEAWQDTWLSPELRGGRTGGRHAMSPCTSASTSRRRSSRATRSMAPPWTRTSASTPRSGR